MPKLKTSAVDHLIGSRIREERERQNLALADIAAQVGTTPAMIHHYETGQAALTVTRLVSIAKALGKKTRFFLEGK